MFKIELKRKRYREASFRAISFNLEALRRSFEKVMKGGIKKVTHEDCGNRKVSHKFLLQTLILNCRKCGITKLVSFLPEEKLAIIRLLLESGGKVELKDITVVCGGEENKAEELFALATREENKKRRLELLAGILERYPKSKWADKALQEIVKLKKESLG